MTTSQEFVTVKGRQIVGPDGEPLLLKGMGIGNWLLPEGYMWGFRRASSPRLIDEVICQLIGEEQARAFWRTFYERFFTQEDARLCKQAGLNHVRASFNWRLLRYSVPLWMGESGENTYEWIAAFRELLETNDIGWCFWTYKRLNTDRCVASIEKPAGWDQIVAFAEHPRSTYKDLREQRPPREVIDQALAEYLDGIRFEACRVNRGYLAALGL